MKWWRTKLERIIHQKTRKTLDRLLKGGYSKDDAMKLIGRAVAAEIYKVLKKKEPFDEKRYVKALRELS